MDRYTVFAAKASKYKNTINDVGLSVVYGIDNPKVLEENTGVSLVKEREMTPSHFTDELTGIEKIIFKKIYGGSIARKLYRLYEYRSHGNRKSVSPSKVKSRPKSRKTQIKSEDNVMKIAIQGLRSVQTVY